jgi:hypothetical protein
MRSCDQLTALGNFALRTVAKRLDQHMHTLDGYLLRVVANVLVVTPGLRMPQFHNPAHRLLASPVSDLHLTPFRSSMRLWQRLCG